MKPRERVILWAVAVFIALGLIKPQPSAADYYKWAGLTIGHIVEPKEGDEVPLGATIRLKCVSALDVDIHDRCANPQNLLNDTVTFSWSTTSGDPESTSSPEVNWTPTATGTATITVVTDDEPDYANDYSRQHSVTVTVVDPTVVYVDKDADGDTHDGLSWETAYTTLWQALGAASTGDGDEIWVAEGVYRPQGQWYTFSISKGVKIYGGFDGTETYRDARDWVKNETVLTGELERTYTYYNVVTISNNSAVLDGFTVTKGRIGWDGAGIYIYGYSPTIRNCIIEDNICDGGDSDGGGMHCYSASPKVINCAFISNKAGDDGGGVCNKHGSSGKFINCAFYDNSTQGHNDLKSDGGAISNTASEQLTPEASNAEFVNCVISSNTTRRWGGGAANRGSNAKYINCTFYKNLATDYTSNDGDGMASRENSVVTVKNCIFWDNGLDYGEDEIWTESGSTTNVSYSDLDGCGGSGSWDTGYGTDGGGNKDIDPSFADTTTAAALVGPDCRWLTYDDGLRIAFDSNCIDSADGSAKSSYSGQTYANADERDAVGLKHMDIRTATDRGTGTNTYYDMGAYEAAVEHVIFISVDGLASYHLDVPELMQSASYMTNMKRIKGEGLWTYQARTDPRFTGTMPNHITMVTGRPVLQPSGWANTYHHGWTYNLWMQSENWTLHMDGADDGRGNDNLDYEASVFDVVHDNAMTSAMYAGKDKFIIFEWSYDADPGTYDGGWSGGFTPPDNDGVDKIDTYEWTGDHDNFHDMDSVELLSKFISSNVPEYDFNFVFFHIKGPDKYGHEYGWGTTSWDSGVKLVDTRLGEIFAMIETVDSVTKIPDNPSWHYNTMVVLTADHGGGNGGTAKDHGDYTKETNFRIPFGVWGHLVPDEDAYVATANRTSPSSSVNPGYPWAPTSSWSGQPIRHADGVDLALNLMGLPSIDGATIKGMKLKN